MTTVVISQPMLFPWPGFFELVAQADIYVHLDDAQYSKGSFVNRVQVKHPAGIKWMTIPLKGSGTFQAIRDLKTDGDRWKGRHRELVSQALAEAPHVAAALALFDRAYARDSVIDILMTGIEESAALVGASPTKWVVASGLGIEGRSWQRVLAIVQALGGTRYVTAHGALHYLDHEAFERAGVSVDYVDYSKTPYPQLHGDFTPYVTILDLVGNLGPLASRALCSKTVSWKQFAAQQDH